MNSPLDVQALVSLISAAEAGPVRDDSDDEQVLPNSTRAQLRAKHQKDARKAAGQTDSARPAQAAASSGPAAIGPAKAAEPSARLSRQKEDAIWDLDEVPHESASRMHVPDARPEPRYEVLYKQRVSSDDVFLGISGATPSIADSPWLLVRIHLPGIMRVGEIQLDVRSGQVDLRCTRYRLLLDLPCAVVERDAKAKWYGDRHTLELTLPREAAKGGW